MDRKRKRELRDLNLRTWDGSRDLFEVSNSLDSALKKNTAFIKRLRTGISGSSQATFLSDIKTLSLQKYLSEIISATAEGLGKLKTASEVAAGAEIVSALHQRFGPTDFTKQLAWLLGRGLTAPDKAQIKSWTQDVREREEKDRLARHRILLRIVTEFWLIGILRGLDDCERPEDGFGKTKESASTGSGKGGDVLSKAKAISNSLRSEGTQDNDPFPLEVLKELLGNDPEHGNLTLAVLFVRNFAWDVLGVKPTSEETRKIVTANGASTDEPNEDGSGNEIGSSSPDESDAPIVPEILRRRFLNVLTRYLQDVKKHILRDQSSLNSQSRRNAEAYVKSGEIFEDRQANFEKQTKHQEKLIANAQTLCDVLGEDMPVLTDKDSTDASVIGSVGMVRTGDYLKGQNDGPGIWEDEDERRFYENLVDLKGRVPAILLDDGKKARPETDEVAGAKSSQGPQESELNAHSNGNPPSTIVNDDMSTSIANKTVGAQVDALLARLPELQTKEMIDQLALDFCFVNSKASRNRLIKSVQEIPKGRTDLLPIYARLVATLGQYMPDVLQGLVSHLDDEFRSLQRRKTKDFLGQVRMINIRYLAELTKFGIVPEHVIFHCFKVSLDDFSRMNIEIIANLLENCGRYLLRNQETSPRMTTFLETLGRKKSAQHLGQQERMLIENAMYYVDPPQRSAIQQKERTPTELFIRQLIYLDMTKRNYMKILKTIRKLHWEEPEVVNILEKIFSKPGKVKFSNIHLLAVLVGALFRYHQDFTISVVDNVLEQITLGLEQNDFKFNQRRVAEAKYLGELYNYKMIDSTVIFDTFYRLVTFGHEGGTPTPGKTTAFDLPDDCFRIRLVCTILDTCGICFDRGSSRKKLDFFLTFFQYYLLTKDPLPMEIDFLVQDTYSLVRPQWRLVTDLAQASRLFSEAISANYKQQVLEKSSELPEEHEESASDDELGDEDGLPEADEEHSTDEAEVVPDENESTKDESESEEEQIFVTRYEESLDPEAEAEFDQAFEKMMAESLDSRKFERKAQFDVPLPIRRTHVGGHEAVDEMPTSEIEAPPNTMAFSLMTKKGNRPQTRTIELPSDSGFALSMKSQQAAEREEQQRIKNLVLNYDLRDENEQHDGILEAFPPGLLNQCLHHKNPYAKGSLITLGPEHHNSSLSRFDKSGRHAHRARKLNLSDVDWYAMKKKQDETENALQKTSPPTLFDLIKAPKTSKKPS